MYYVFTCGNSGNFDYAFDDLAYLDNIEKVRGKTRISGRLSSGIKDAPSFANIKIKIIGNTKTYEIETDENGFYEIYDLPAGEYIIQPQKLKGWMIDKYWLQFSPSVLDYVISKNQITIILREKRHAALDLLFEIDILD